MTHPVVVEYARELQVENERLKRELADYKRLEALLEDRADVVDGPEGSQRANAEASVLAHWRGK